MSDENKEQSKDQSAEASQVKVEFVVPDPESELFSTYANNIQVAWTYYDIRMVFGEVVDLLPNKIVIEQRAQITIAYLQAKLLIDLLTQAVAKHESVFGQMQLPAEGFDIGTSSAMARVPPGGSARKP